MRARGRIKGLEGPGQFSLEVTSDVLHDVIVCKIYVFTDSQRFRLFFLVVENVLAVFTRWLAARDCKPHELELKN